MFIVKIMGIMDFLTGIMVILFNYDLIGVKVLLVFLLYILIKGIAFRGDVASFIDLGIAIYMLLMLILPVTILSYIVAIYLFQKGAVSML